MKLKLLKLILIMLILKTDKKLETIFSRFHNSVISFQEIRTNNQQMDPKVIRLPND